MAQTLKKLILGGVFILLCALGVRPHVTHAASLFFSPSSGNFVAGTPFTVVAALNTSGVIANAADVSITYPKNILSVSSVSTTGSPITLWVMSPTFDNSAGTLVFTGGQPRPGFNGPAITLVTITFMPLTAGTATINYTGLSVLSGDGLASELLTGLGSATYNVAPAPPPADVQAPRVSLPSPSNGTSGAPLTSDVAFKITDDKSGVDLNTVSVNINGTIYTLAGPNTFTTTGTPLDYTVTVSHATPWPADTEIFVKVNAKDIAGNTMGVYQWSFNKFVVVPVPPPPPVDSQAPKVSWPTPPNGVSGVPLDSDVMFRITDNLSGVNLSTLTVNINGIIYSQGGPNTLSAVGIPTDYTVTVSHATPWPVDTLISVKVNAKDIAGNTMGVYSWSFNKFVVVPVPPPPPVDTQAPKVSWPTPPNAVTGVPLDSDLSFRITDNISGVDLNTLIVNINGVDYSGGAISPVGSPTDYTVTVSHAVPWPADTQINVRVNAKDVVGNTMNPYQWYFNRPPPVPIVVPPPPAPIPTPPPAPIVCPTPGDFIPSTAVLPDTPVAAIMSAVVPNIALPTTPAQVIPAITAVPNEIQRSVSNAVTVVRGSIVTGVAGFLRPTTPTKPVIDAQGNIECPVTPQTVAEAATQKSNWFVSYALFFIGLLIGALFKELFITHKLRDKKAPKRAPLKIAQPQAQPYSQSLPR